MSKLGILGGTFNPIHMGHLLMAEAAFDQLQLDQVLWVPAAYPPHRSPSDLVAVSHRVEMVRAAIAPHPAFDLSTVDLDRLTPSYAADTFAALQLQHPHSQWHWILGLDAFQSLPQWYRRHTWIQQCCWLVAPRSRALYASPVVSNPVASNTAAESAPDQIAHQVTQILLQQGLEIHYQLLQMPQIEISSSLIRHYCRDRRSIRYLVPDAVLTYIHQHHLYQ